MKCADFIFDAEYGYHFNAMCENVWARIDLGLNTFMLLGGSSSILGAFSSNNFPSTLGGVALAFCSAVALLCKPAEKALLHKQAKAHYLKLKGLCPEGSAPKKLEQALVDLQSTSPNGMRLLEVPAFNRALNSLGYSDGQRKVGIAALLAVLLA